MSEALYVGPFDEEQVTVPAGGYNPGDIVQTPSLRAGVVQGQRPLDEGEEALLATEGKFEVAAASATVFTAGDEIEWDNVGKLAVAATLGTFNIGRAGRDKVAGETTVLVILNHVTE